MKPLTIISIALILIAGLFIGNRLFNHINSWIGIFVTFATIAFVWYYLIKKSKDDEE